jgi:hypothetical protein
VYFNRRYKKTVGHLFQGRYKAILCDKDAYLVSLVKYIHLNPIRAGVVRTLDSYRWSSHGVYAGGERGNRREEEAWIYAVANTRGGRRGVWNYYTAAAGQREG